MSAVERIHFEGFKNCQKPKWSFAKDKRFNQPSKLIQILSQEPTQKYLRYTSIGLNKKNKIISKGKQNPAPKSYNSEQSFQQQKKSKKGFSFGSSRQENKFCNYLQSMEKTPAPTDYEISRRSTRNHAYSLRGRYNHYLIIDKQLIPSPGYYQQSNEMTAKFQKVKQKLNNIKKIKERVRTVQNHTAESMSDQIIKNGLLMENLRNQNTRINSKRYRILSVKNQNQNKVSEMKTEKYQQEYKAKMVEENNENFVLKQANNDVKLL